ncbi:DgyrCDS13537 [Dimorphilus gyrociliatus]|nr:DgyrCDS13537 [Dimorphilus gyrociliatus]
MSVSIKVYHLWIYGEFMCKITWYLQGVSCSASVLTIMTLAFDRHLAIKHPIKFRKFSTGNYAWKFISAIWLTSLAIMLPLCIVREIRFVYPFTGVVSQELPYCMETWSSDDVRIAYGFLLCVFLFVLPTLVLVYSYSVIGKQLWRENAGIPGEIQQRKINQSQLHKVMLNRRKVARMLVILALLFAICWIPYYINSIYLDFVPPTDNSARKASGALSFTTYLGHFNSAINPILYCFMNATFRRSARKLFCRSCYKKKMNKTNEGNVDMMVIYSQLRSNKTRTCPINNKRHLLPPPPLDSRRKFSSPRSTGTRTTSSETSCPTRSSNVSQRSSETRSTFKRSPEIELEGATCQAEKSTNSVLEILEQYFGDNIDRKRREMFNCTLSIPTTINEETSRSNISQSPIADRQTMAQIAEDDANQDIVAGKDFYLESDSSYRLSRFFQSTRDIEVLKGDFEANFRD